jgi:hypothetical protein
MNLVSAASHHLPIFLLLSSISSVVPSQASDLRTLAEKSDWTKTGRSDETARLCEQFQKTYPSRIQCKTYGTTPEGRSLKVLILKDDSSAKSVHNPVIWIQAGIHAGEIDGKDAGFLLLKEVLEKKITPDPTRGLTLVFVPIVNLDGHERFGKWNRPNQVGPKEMGWRTTSQNLNLNRDFAKADAPEMQALLKLWGEMDPILSADLHVTDGAKFQPEVGVIIAPADNGSSELRTLSKELEKNLMAKLAAEKHLALPYYPELEKENDPLSGFSRSVSTARFSEGYWSTRNRIGILVETHSWKNYANRVKSQHDVVLALLELAQKNATAWIKASRELDTQDLSDQKVDLEFHHNEHSSFIEFPGYHFTRDSHSKVSGGTFIHYFDDQPEIWKVPYFDEVAPTLSVRAPEHGYLIPPSAASWLRKKLDLHQIHYVTYTGKTQAHLQTFRANETEFAKSSYEGHQGLKVKGEWKEENLPIIKGTLFIPIHQANARLILTLLEPLSADSFLAWGFFNSAFEQKEYMEDYVAEIAGAEMLKNDPKIREAFNTRLRNDRDFANSPKQRLEFFYRKDPSWDARFNLYPVFRM